MQKIDRYHFFLQKICAIIPCDMIANFLIGLRAILPIFLTLCIGMIVRKAGLMTVEESRRLNRVVFVVFFFAMLFNNIYKNDIGDVIRPKLILFGAVSILLVYAGALFVALKIEKNNRSRGALIHAIYRSNFVIIGMPLAMNICGEENMGVTAMMIAVVVPMYNVLAVITLEVFRGGNPNPLNMLFQLIKNPMVDGAICGMIFLLLDIKLPESVAYVMDSLSSAATPLALIILGVSFSLSDVKNTGRNITVAVLGRLIVVPGVILTLAALLGFRGVEFVTLLGIFAAPCAVASYTMALSMDSDYELAGSAVVISSMFSCITMFLWVLIFKTLGIF